MMRRRDVIGSLGATAVAWPLVSCGLDEKPQGRVYYASPNLFADGFAGYDHEPERVAVGQLIERYGIRNKRVLSLGGGSVFEERWFATLAGNQLTVIDIDEHKSAEPLLKTATPGPMKYIVGDALDTEVDEHDVLYASGFTPDEMRRREIVAPAIPRGRHAQQWRLSWEPFHPAFMRHTRKLTPGGLMIVQSIGYSIDADYHPRYVLACRQQLIRNGLRLIELWRFKLTRGVMLYVAQKEGGQPPPMQTPLTTFHGRATVREPIERIYPKAS
jgi:hypothetical protein